MPGTIHTHASQISIPTILSCECSTIAIPNNVLHIITSLANSIQELHTKDTDIHCTLQDHTAIVFNVMRNHELKERWTLNLRPMPLNGMLELSAIQARILQYRTEIPNRQHSPKPIHIHQETCLTSFDFGHVATTAETLTPVDISRVGSFDLTVERLHNVTQAVPIKVNDTSDFPSKINSFQDHVTKTQNISRVISRRRLSCLSISALQDEDSQFSCEEHLHRTTVSRNKQLQYTIANHRNHTSPSSFPPTCIGAVDIPMPRMARRKSTVEPFVGSFEECLLNNRMSSTPTATIQFQATICAVARGSVKKRENLRPSGPLSLDFEAHMYQLDGKPLPYAGSIDLNQNQYRIPPKGQLQVLIIHGDRGAVKGFVVSYDLRDMPANHSTFVRRREYITTSDSGMRTLKYAIHIPIKSSKHKQIHLHGPIRVVFSNHANNADDKVEVKMEYPSVSCKYLPLDGDKSMSSSL